MDPSQRPGMTHAHITPATSLARQIPLAGPALPVLALVAGALAQWLLDLDRWVGPAWALFLLAAILFGLWSRQFACRDASDDPNPPYDAVPFHVRWPWVGLSLGLAALAWLYLGGNLLTGIGVMAWGGALLCVMLAVWRGRPWRSLDRLHGGTHRHDGLYFSWPTVGVLGAMALAVFFRLHRIQVIPLEMGCDLPLIQFNIAQILEGEYPIFFTSHPGREGLFFYLAAPIAAVMGLSHVSIKVTSALIGVLTVPAVYWLGRELYDRWAGVLAALFLAISHWHIILTRIGYRAALMPLLVALAWLFLLRGLKSGRGHDYALSGLWAGLGLQTYNAFMAVPPLFMGLLLIAWVARRRLGVNMHGHAIAIWALVAFLAALPLMRYAYEEQESYLYRVATRATDLEQDLPTSVAATLAGNVTRAAGMFHHVGDIVHTSNVPHHRQLGLATGVLFVLGLGHAVAHGWRKQLWTGLLLLPGLLMPSIMALAFPEEVPSAVRAIGVLPVAVVLPALALRRLCQGLEASWNVMSNRPQEGRRLAARLGLTAIGLALIGALVAETVAVYPLYFDRYVWHQPHHNQSISLKLAQTIDRSYGDGEVYLMIWPHWYDGNAVRAQFRRTPREWNNERYELSPGKAPLDEVPGRVTVIMHPEEQATLQLLQEHYDRYMVLENRWDDGSVAMRIFVGER